jgi:hypothetical protein
MARLLRDIAYVRSGDKGDTVSIGVIAKSPTDYANLRRSITPARINALYGNYVLGKVTIYPLDNLEAVNIVMERALGGGATRTLRLDQTGKALGSGILRLEILEDGRGD